MNTNESAEDIHRGLANANRLMARILLALADGTELCISAIRGGSKDNAIPRDCTATVMVKDRGKAIEIIHAEAKKIADELSDADRSFACTVNTCTAETVFDADFSARLLAAISNAPCGVIEMSRDVEGLVEWSSNLGVITTENDRVTLTFQSRSTIEARLDHTTRIIDALAKACGGTAKHHGRYTGWNFEKDSPLRDSYLAAYHELFGGEAKPVIIHAGLECGLIRARIPDMDMISIGPENIGLHSPSERLNIASAERFWQILERMLGE